MAGRPNSHWLATMIQKHGSLEEVSRIMAERGAVGGQRGHTGGFYKDRKLASIAGAKGGRISRRTKKAVK